jgi:hypothetical protein
MNFGQPHLFIREPKHSAVSSERSRLRFAHRLVTVRGRWWLWLFGSKWTLDIRGLGAVRGSASAKRIEQALNFLSGQCLVHTEIDPTNSRTRFQFDLGATLDVRDDDGATDIWSLYKPDGRVLSVRGDGAYSLGPGNVVCDYEPIVTGRPANKPLKRMVGRRRPPTA